MQIKFTPKNNKDPNNWPHSGTAIYRVTGAEAMRHVKAFLKDYEASCLKMQDFFAAQEKIVKKALKEWATDVTFAPRFELSPLRLKATMRSRVSANTKLEDFKKWTKEFKAKLEGTTLEGWKIDFDAWYPISLPGYTGKTKVRFELPLKADTKTKQGKKLSQYALNMSRERAAPDQWWGDYVAKGNSDTWKSRFGRRFMHQGSLFSTPRPPPDQDATWPVFHFLRLPMVEGGPAFDPCQAITGLKRIKQSQFWRLVENASAARFAALEKTDD